MKEKQRRSPALIALELLMLAAALAFIYPALFVLNNALKPDADITLPLLVPAFTVCLFLSLSNSLKCFDLVYAMVGPSGYAVGTVPLVMDIFFDAFAKRLAGLATAKAILLFLAIVLITGVQLSVMKRREVQQ